MSDAKSLALRLAKETARRFGREALRPLWPQRRERGGLPPKVGRAFAELGLGLAPLPQEAGGIGLGPLSGALIAEALAAGDVNAAFGLPQPGAFADALIALGTSQQRKMWLHPFFETPQTAQGALIIGPPGAIRAKPDREHWVISGAVAAAWHASRADRLVVVADAVNSEGLPLPERRAVVLAREHDGVVVDGTIAPRGLPLSDVAPVRLREVRVAKPQWLGGGGDASMGLRHAFTLQTLRMGSLALGAAHAASAYMVGLAEERRQNGQQSAHFHSLGFLLVDMHLACEAAFLRLRQAAEAPTPDETEVAAARTAADEVAFFVTESAHQMLVDGGEDPGAHPIAAWHEDIQVLARCYRADAYFSPAMQAASPQGAPDFLC